MPPHDQIRRPDGSPRPGDATRRAPGREPSTGPPPRLAQYGPNRISGEKPPSVSAIALAQLREPMNLMLVAVTAVSFVIGEVPTAIFVALLVVLNLVLGSRHSECTFSASTSSECERLKMPMRPRSGQRARDPPQEVVAELLRGRLLERDDLHALRVDVVHDVLDHGVLAGSVHRLQDDEQRVAVARPQQLLRLGELGAPLPPRVDRALLALVVGQVGELRAAPSSPGRARRAPPPHRAGR
jgi:hypothetical protein